MKLKLAKLNYFCLIVFELKQNMREREAPNVFLNMWESSCCFSLIAHCYQYLNISNKATLFILQLLLLFTFFTMKVDTCYS